jgi:membrane protein required for colicin V production
LRVNPIDLLLLVLLVPFAVQGWRRGLCREGFALFGIIGGLIVAVATAPAVAGAIIAAGKPELAAYPIALALVLLAAIVVARGVGALVARAMRAVFLGGLDRAAGIAFGTLKGAACLGLILILLERFMSTPAQMAIEGSVLGPTLIGVATSVLDMGRELSAVMNRV